MEKKDFKKAYQRMVNAQRAAMFIGVSTGIDVQYTEQNARFGKLDPYSVRFRVYDKSFEPFGVEHADFAICDNEDFENKMSYLEDFLRSKGARI